MSTASVVHLHNHTTYSLRDGIQMLGDMCETAAADGQPAIAITDHGSLAGAWKLSGAAEKVGIKPILGVEAYLAIGSRFAPEAVDHPGVDGAKGKVEHYRHLTVLAQTATGWSNILKMSHLAHDTRYRDHPLIDLETLAAHSDGLIVLTGCMSGPVLGPLVYGQDDVARANLSQLMEVFDDSHLWVEIMDHGIASERAAARSLVELARWSGLRMVATNDAHYTRPGQHDAHEAWLCVGQADTTLQTPGRWSFDGAGYHLRTAAEMRALFDGEESTAEAVDNSLVIASMVDDRVLPEAKTRLPSFRLPDGELPVGSDEWLYQRVRKGAVARYGSPLPGGVKERLRTELDVIGGAHLADYFLVVADMIDWARSRGIRVGPGRGSAAGCCAAYCLGIIDIDPLAHGLLFERFLNPERATMPDIDTDFEVDRRDEVIAYLSQRWGRDRVARIGTYGMLLAAAALRQAGRVMGRSDVGAKLAGAVATGAGGKVLPLGEMLDGGSEAGEPLRRAIAADPAAADVVGLARSIEGVVNSASIHPCGVIVSDEPLPGLIPLRRDTRDGASDVLVSEWDGKDVDALGLLKLDVLGLRNLDGISRCVEIIEASTGERVDADHPDEDPRDPRAARAWRMIASGDTAGVFQLESSGMKALCSSIQPTSVDELAAIVALFRPGPLGAKMHELYAARKVGATEVSYETFTNDPDEAAAIATVLDETLGVPIFQEQLMSLGRVVAGFGAGERNRLQKAISKKLREEMDAVGQLFVDGAMRDHDVAGQPKLAFRRQTAENVWAAMQGAGDYAFNKSHALGYAQIAWTTAWLKANWPGAFGAALLAVTRHSDKRMSILRSLRDEGVVVLCPDVNEGRASTSLDASGAVRLGMAEAKGVHAAAAIAVEQERAKGPFTSLADLLQRVVVTTDEGTAPLDAGTVDALIESGATDAFGPRMGLMMAVRAIRDDGTVPVPNVEWGPQERCARERDRLGIIVSTHPLTSLRQEVAAWKDRIHHGRAVPIHKIDMDAEDVVTIGVVSQFDIVKKGRRRARLVLEGTHADIECTIWSRGLSRLEEDGNLPAVGQIICVRGRPNVWRYERQSDVADGIDDDESGSAGSVEVIERRELSIESLTIGDFGNDVRWGEDQPMADVFPYHDEHLPAA